MKNVKVRRVLTYIALALILIAAIALQTPLFGYFCLFRHITGLPCPGCGMTRAWAALLRGDIAAAVSFHPLFWCAPALIAEIALYSVPQKHIVDENRARRVKKRREVILFILCAAFVAVWAARLLSGWRG